MHGFVRHNNTDTNRQLESSAEWKNTKPNRQISQIPPSRAAAAAEASQQCKCGEEERWKNAKLHKKNYFLLDSICKTKCGTKALNGGAKNEVLKTLILQIAVNRAHQQAAESVLFFGA